MPTTRNRMIPKKTASSCLGTEEGAEEAVTARDNVDRKKAMVSISKPVRPSARSVRQ